MRIKVPAVAFLAFLCFAFQATAADVRTATYNLDIPAQSLNDALQALALASQHKLLYSSELVDGKTAPPLKGEFTTEQAVRQLLTGTGLEYDVSDGLVLIRSKDSTLPVSLQEGRGEGADSALHGARVADATSNLGESVVSSTSGMRVAQADSEQGSRNSTAPPDESSSAELEEIVVTAQKRVERLQDVPISISVLSGEDLDRSNVEGVTAVLRRVPGVTISKIELAGATTITMRGVSSGGPLFNGAPTVAYYVDSVPFGLVKSALVPDPNVYDLDRIEVLKGPQGTLYGANSVNGVVRVLTNDADLNEFAFKARAGASSTKGGDEGYRGDMAVNVPLIEGKLAARLMAGYEHTGGWIDHLDRKNANDGNLSNVRLKLNWQPTDALSVGVSAWRSQSDYGATQRSDLNDVRPVDVDESIDSGFDAYGVKLGYEFGGGYSLTSMTSYLDYDNDAFIVFVPPNIIPLTTKISSKVFSEELLLNSPSTGPWVWSLGAFYRDATDNLFQFIPPPVIPAPIDFDDDSKSMAAFGQLTRKLVGDRLELTAGLRYFRDEVAQIENIANDANPTRPLLRAEDTFTAWTPRGVVTWHASDRAMIYGSYSEGFRSGFNQNANVLVQHPSIPPADPDKLRNYEVGSKGELLDGRVSYEVAAYYVDWKDVQLTINVPVGATFASAVVNAASASGPGADLALTFRPLDGLALAVNVSANDLEVDEPVQSGVVQLFDTGDPLNFSTRYTLGGSLDYSFPLGRAGYTGRFAASANRIAGYQQRQLQGTTLAVRNGDTITDARTSFTVSSPHQWDVTLFAENVLDDRGIINEFNPTTATLNPPLRFGIQLEYHFGR